MYDDGNTYVELKTYIYRLFFSCFICKPILFCACNVIHVNYKAVQFQSINIDYSLLNIDHFFITNNEFDWLQDNVMITKTYGS